MKNVFKIALLSAGVFVTAQGYAQAQEDHNVGHKIGHAAQVVGHKTSEVAVKGAVAIADKRYEGHWAPTGENVYIDKHSRYFYVDKAGHYKYLKKWQLRNKPYKD